MLLPNSFPVTLIQFLEASQIDIYPLKTVLSCQSSPPDWYLCSCGGGCFFSWREINENSLYILTTFSYLSFWFFKTGFLHFANVPHFSSFCLFVCLFVEKGFLCVVLTVLELCRPGWPGTQKSDCLCLPSAGIKGVHHHAQF